MLLETYRECLRDVFDMPALVATLRRIETREIKAVTVDSAIPSPFASALLFGYVANYIYDGDAPLAERRAQALAIDQTQLRELLGEAELRELLDADALAQVEAQLQHLDATHQARSTDGAARSAAAARRSDRRRRSQARSRIDAAAALAELVQDAPRHRGAASPASRGSSRSSTPAVIATRSACRCRRGCPDALLQPSPNAGARSGAALCAHARPVHHRRASPNATASAARPRTCCSRSSRPAAGCSKASSGPAAAGREWCDPDVLQSMRRRSLAKLRKEVEPVDPPVLGRLITSWQGVVRRRSGLDALLDTIENLQGAPLPASIFESEILAARIDGYNPSDLDALTAGGEIVWCGVEPLGERDGRIALYLTDHFAPAPARGAGPTISRRASRAIVAHLAASGASFFADLHQRRRRRLSGRDRRRAVGSGVEGR